MFIFPSFVSFSELARSLSPITVDTAFSRSSITLHAVRLELELESGSYIRLCIHCTYASSYAPEVPVYCVSRLVTSTIIGWSFCPALQPSEAVKLWESAKRIWLVVVLVNVATQ